MDLTEGHAGWSMPSSIRPGCARDLLWMSPLALLRVPYGADRLRPALASHAKAGPFLLDAIREQRLLAAHRCGGFTYWTVRGPHQWYLDLLVSRPGRRGVGHALLDTVLMRADLTGAAIDLHCPKTLSGFYASAGFRPTLSGDHVAPGVRATGMTAAGMMAMHRSAVRQPRPEQPARAAGAPLARRPESPIAGCRASS